ncbi:hypothetical protein BGZ47_003945 [Haplosporangium gracile]|nr:hypothetical protein BGZ47_003945 [Haplosporangium gracile]
MGIPETELGLTSGWYHGFKRRHGIKHRQFKPKGGNAASTGSDGPTLGSIGLSGAGNNASGSMMDQGDGSDGVEGDEEMEDVGQDGSNGPGGDDDRLSSAMRPLRTTDDNPSYDSGPGIDPDPSSPSEMSQGGSNNAGSSSSQQYNMTFTPKEPQLSTLSRRPEVKKVDASKANDALDVISEYLLQNGQIGAAKLPLVKELRKFFLVQMALENGPINENILLTSLAHPVPLPGPTPIAVTVPEPRDESAPSPTPMVTSDHNVFVNNSEPAPRYTGREESSSSPSSGGAGLAQILGTDRSPLSLSSSALANMENVLTGHNRQPQQEQERSPSHHPSQL